MFEKLKEMYREAQAMQPLRSDFEKLCPDTAQRNELIRQFGVIHSQIECPHNESHILTAVVEMLRYDAAHRESRDGIFVEAGCFRGGSTAKLSLVAKMLGRKLIVFDSFEGIPANNEAHNKSIFGYSIQDWFHQAAFSGGLDEVRANVEAHGAVEQCELVKGWFDDTLPSVDFPIAGAYIDVDLASSTRTCIRYLYPLLQPGGFLISQDGDFPLVIEVFEDRKFWEEEIGCQPPKIHGLRKSKMLKIYKS